MARVMAVSFERYGRLYYLDPGDAMYAVGDKVLVPTDSGPEVAECVWAPEWVDDDPGYADLPLCAGKADQADLDRDAANRRRRAVAELARSLRARIDLRQIGSRDAARLTGGLGSCGRDLCCATFLKDFEPVTLRMAKLQELPPNPLRISGACGRLLCCIKYEHPLYADFARQVPAVGQRVTTDEGEGTVVAHQVPADSVLVRMSASGAMTSCSRASVCGSRHAYDSRAAAPEEPMNKLRRRRRN